MAKNSEYRMAIKIAGEIEKSLYTSTDMTRKELNKIAKEAAYASTKTKNTIGKGIRDAEPFFEGLEKTGVKAFKAIAAAAVTAGTATLAIGVMAGKAGIEYESAFAGVKKTTDATAQEYEVMRQEILAMTREIPASANEIANVAEAAGQLGIKKDDLLEFSRTMIDLGESTNLSSTEAATSLAKFANITKMGTDSYGNLGSVIVDLGNNFATTEADIVEMGTRLAASGELAGFTEAQIMAMATAMSSVGIEAESGGSSMSKLTKSVQVAVETGNKSLNDYAKVAGMTSADFKKAFEKDAVSAIASFISGLNDVERNGKSATVILEEMGLTETRLSNTITSLANADTLMYDALETANKAWEENTALSIEAGKRYETTESKLTVMRQGFTEMGIEISDQFNEPLRDGIDIITDLIHMATDEIGSSNVINELAQGIVDGVPTAIRVTKQFTEAVGDMAEPVIELGGWLVENPGVIEGTIVGIGTAIIGYKVVNNVSKLAAALKNLSGPGLAVMAITGAVSVIAGIGTAIKQSAEEAKQANLEEHFGDIALSISEVDDAAKQIIGNQYFEKMDDMMSSSINSNNLMKSMKNAIQDINETKWKLSLGITLSEEDTLQYTADVEQYISSAQNYITSQGYTVQVAAELLLSDSSEMDSIVADNQSFYKQLTEKAQGIGDEIDGIISKSLESGLTIDQEEINRLLEQMQEITNAISVGADKAKLQRIEAEFSGKDLNSDSIQALAQRLNEYVEEGNESALNAYEELVAANHAQKELGIITEEEYNQKDNAALEGLHNRQIEGTTNAYDFMYNTIMDTYGAKLKPAMGSTEQYMQDELNRIMASDGMFNTYSSPEDWGNQTDMIVSAAMDNEYKLDNSTKGAVNTILKEMMPLQEQMETINQRIVENGGTITPEMNEKLNSVKTELTKLSAMGGSESGMWGMFGGIASENEDYAAVLAAAQQQGAAIPQAAINAIEEMQPEAVKTAQGYMDAMKVKFGEGFDATIPISVTYEMMNYYNKNGTLGGHKEGGIFDTPHVAWFSEDGPEAAIPIDGSKRSISLWQQTGEMLGVMPNKGGHSIISDFLNDTGSTSNTVNNSEENAKFSYSPTYQFYGEAPSGKELDEHVEASFEKWEEMMNRWMRNNKRFKFSS